MSVLNISKIALCTLTAAGLSAPLASAKHHGHGHGKGSLEQCLEAASKIKAGDFVKVEFLSPSPEGAPTYEIEVRDAAGQEWEFMCDATSGHIYEIEQEVDSSTHQLFSKSMKVSEENARARVLELYPGEIKEIEYEIESTGRASYEFDVEGPNGVEFKVEVDAASGEVVEVSVERWQIGQEASSRPSTP